MKLRSRDIEAGPISQTTATTQKRYTAISKSKELENTSLANRNKSTAFNSSAFLLQLPQELKNQIFTYLLGGRCIHVEDGKTKNKQRPYLLYPCRIGMTSSWKDRVSYEETDDDNDDDTAASDPRRKDPHRKCYGHMMLAGRPRGIDARGGPRWYFGDQKNKREFYRPHRPMPLHIPIHLLLTCRQLYHELNHILYSANTFCFQDPELLIRFISHLDSLPSGSKTLAVRHLHLHIRISTRTHEEDWNRALSAAASHLPNLNSIDISIKQGLWNRPLRDLEKRLNPSISKEDTFLVGLSGLKKLQSLMEVTISVYQVVDHYAGTFVDTKVVEQESNPADPEKGKFLWSREQQREWAWDLVAGIFGREENS